MSMIGNYRRISPDDLSELIANPDSIMDIFDEDETTGYPADVCLDIDKTWKAIHFLLTGEMGEGEPPLSYAVLGGKLLGDIDVGYGPARYITPAQVKEVAKALQAIPRDMLLSRFNLKRFRDEGIYPTILEGGPEDMDYIGSYYEKLVSFMVRAGQAGDAMLLYLN